MHCHIFLHEDVGMMMVVNIVPQGLLLRIRALICERKQRINRDDFPTSPDQEFSVILISTDVDFF